MKSTYHLVPRQVQRGTEYLKILGPKNNKVDHIWSHLNPVLELDVRDMRRKSFQEEISPRTGEIWRATLSRAKLARCETYYDCKWPGPGTPQPLGTPCQNSAHIPGEKSSSKSPPSARYGRRDFKGRNRTNPLDHDEVLPLGLTGALLFFFARPRPRHLRAEQA